MKKEECEVCKFREFNIGYPSPCPEHAKKTLDGEQEKCEDCRESRQSRDAMTAGEPYAVRRFLCRGHAC